MENVLVIGSLLSFLLLSTTAWIRYISRQWVRESRRETICKRGSDVL